MVEEEGGVGARQQCERPLAGATMRAAGRPVTNGAFRGTAPGLVAAAASHHPGRWTPCC